MNLEVGINQPESSPTGTGIGALRRGILVGSLALGLLMLGGVAAVSAAHASASPAPSAGATQPAVR
jgi:hypothetical protein